MAVFFKVSQSVIFLKQNVMCNYANFNWYDIKAYLTNYGHNQAHVFRSSPCSKTKVRQAEAVFMHSKPIP